MEISELLKTFASNPKLEDLAGIIRNKEVKQAAASGLVGSSAAVMFAALTLREDFTSAPYIYVFNDEESAGYFYNDLARLLGEERVLFFPSSFRRAVKYGQRDAANEILRAEVLTRIVGYSGDWHFVVTYPEALAERVVDSNKIASSTLTIHVGEECSQTETERKLFELGFSRTDYVYLPGEFAVRGSILDVYSFSSEFPYRIDFFGDEIDTIRTFDVQSQLSEKRCNEAVILPNISEHMGTHTQLTSLLPPTSILVMENNRFVSEKIAVIHNEGFASQARVESESEGVVLSKEETFITQTEYDEGISPFKLLEIRNNSEYREDKHEVHKKTKVHFSEVPQQLYHKNFELLVDSMRELTRRKYKIYVGADSAKQNERLRDIIESIDSTIHFTPLSSTLHSGFIDNDMRVCIFTDHQIFDRFHKYNLRSANVRNAKVALTLKEIQQFEPGDYVVHIDHGIGTFAGLVKIPVGDSYQEVIKITYRDGAAVFVSIHSLHKINKYRGHEGTPPHISKLGSGSWERMKERTKNKIKDIARDLIKLYAQRRSESGFAFSKDSFMQQELEASFRYEDTPDQLKVTQEVKSDMERSLPMDRLVCGDVGFGKTEIAVRAACKAAADNKQVTVLVPTTVLAFQHYRTFSERLKDFPICVEYLSRARTAAETKKVLAGLENGEVSIIVGTHKLLSKRVKWHDLGLLIIDEEQKFGVSVKEKLRQMKVNVDTLTMSATPIPRTLQFSLMGARDLSVIATPPPNRRPIDTRIETFSPEVIGEAVNFELSRNGQVFVVTDRIASLPKLSSIITTQVRDARVAIAHGRLSPETMEQTIMGFINHDFDVLISTTIVENGIDIPNANTIIIDSAHHFGLSDLHQMRGRVGRSDRKAFCYLLAPPLSSLPTDSRRRLEAIESFSDLGSGIHIAMQDLDIRGAGNVLGAEQSGFVADLGYETYQKILKEAVTELKNDEFSDIYVDDISRNKDMSGDLFVDECTFDSDRRIYFPETFVPGSSERMLLYRELDGLSSEKEVAAYRKRLEDRFGSLPAEAEALLCVVILRSLGQQLGVERIVLKGGKMNLFLVSNRESAYYRSTVFDNIIRYATAEFHRCGFSDKDGKARVTISDVTEVAEASKVLKQILEI